MMIAGVIIAIVKDRVLAMPGKSFVVPPTKSASESSEATSDIFEYVLVGASVVDLGTVGSGIWWVSVKRVIADSEE